MGGVEPAFYGPKEGLSGDDFSGVVAAVAGLCLVILGVVTAWRARKRDSPLAWRYGRRLLLGVAWVVGLYFVLFPLALSYGFTHVARVDTPHGNLGAPYETVSFATSDGLELDGWYVRSRNGAVVIVDPGKKGTQNHARMLVRHGYGVLLFDRRGEGTSDGDPNALGSGFDDDLKGALAYLRSRGVDPDRIGGLGLSVGGEALLETAGRDHRRQGSRLGGRRGALGARGHRSRVCEQAARDLVLRSDDRRNGALSNRLPPPNLKSLAGRIEHTPVFFVYATKGAGGEDNNPEYYAAAREPKRIWKIDTSHTHGLTARPVEYERRVVGFFDRTLSGD